MVLHFLCQFTQVRLYATIVNDADDVSDGFVFEPNPFARFQDLGTVDALCAYTHLDGSDRASRHPNQRSGRRSHLLPVSANV